MGIAVTSALNVPHASRVSKPQSSPRIMLVGTTPHHGAIAGVEPSLDLGMGKDISHNYVGS